MLEAFFIPALVSGAITLLIREINKKPILKHNLYLYECRTYKSKRVRY